MPDFFYLVGGHFPSRGLEANRQAAGTSRALSWFPPKHHFIGFIKVFLGSSLPGVFFENCGLPLMTGMGYDSTAEPSRSVMTHSISVPSGRFLRLRILPVMIASSDFLPGKYMA